MRIMLDSNVWRYIVDGKAVADVQHAARKSSHSIVIAPAIAYEALRTGTKSLRDELIAAMTIPAWKRPMSEAYSMAEEIKAEVVRLRPEWVREPPDLTMYRRLRHDWLRSRGGVWDRMRHDPDGELRGTGDASMLERARAQARMLRDEAAKKLPQKLAAAALLKNLASFDQPTDGWDGTPFALWRMDGLNVFRAAMATERHATVDWLYGEINLNLMMLESASLVRFWAHDVELRRMPRHWMMSAFEFLQRFHKVTDGTPVDNALGSYLLDADAMLSADRNFVRIAERCREEAPFTVARTLEIPGGPQAVEAVLRALKSPPKASNLDIVYA